MMLLCPQCGQTGHDLSHCPDPVVVMPPPASATVDDTAPTRGNRLLHVARHLLGRIPFVPDAVAMYFCMLDPRTAFWVKTTVLLSLLYLLFPLDWIPDLIPGLGQVDDAMIVYSAFRAVHAHITDAHVERARDWLEAA